MPRVLIIDKTAGLQSSHERHVHLAEQPGIDLHVLGPQTWIESGRRINWKPDGSASYTTHVGKVFYKDYYARAGYYKGLFRSLSQSQPDIIHLLEEPWSISALQTVLAASIVAPTAHIIFYTWENIYRPWTYPSRASRLYAIIDKILHHRSTAAICATEEAQSVLRRKGFCKPAPVIHYGIPQFFFNPITVDKKEMPFTIGYLGRLLHMKGIDLLLQALLQLKECRLLLTGTGEDAEAYKKRAINLGINDRIDWVGTISEHRVVEIISRMDVFVLPSRTTPNWKEQLGRAAIEAMALGTPIIGSTSGAIPEVIGDAGLLFRENDVDHLVQQIRFLMEHPKERLRYIETGKKRARDHFTWNQFARSVSTFYKSILEPPLIKSEEPKQIETTHHE